MCFEVIKKHLFSSIDNVLVFSLEAFTQVSNFVLFFGEKVDIELVTRVFVVGCLESHSFS